MAFKIAKSREDIILEKEAIISDKTKTLEERKQAYSDIMSKVLNPLENFNPATFDPFDEDPDIEVKRRPRTKPPKYLPTMGMYPKQLLEGQLVGMLESKQDLYLLIAHLWNRVADLEDEVNKGKT